MADSAMRSDVRLPELLAISARALPERRLVVLGAAGIVVAAATVIWRPGLWVPLVSAGLSAAAFGAWGIADRHARRGRGFRLLRSAAVGLGTLAGIALAVSIVSLGFGYWKS